MPFFAKHSDDAFQKLELLLAERTSSLETETQARLSAEVQVSNLQAAVTSEISQRAGEVAKRVALESQVSELQKTVEAGKAQRTSEVAKLISLENQVAELKKVIEAERAQRKGEASSLATEARRRMDAEKQLAEDKGKFDARVNAASRENAELLTHLHAVQAELEKYFLKNKDLESSVGEVTASLRNARHVLMNSKLGPAISSPRLLGRN
jgi:chromosome segregation ATPase